MEAQAATGSLAAIGTASKAFVLAHPMGVAITGGALLGMGVYHTTRKLFTKKPAVEIAAPADATPATVSAT